MSAAAILPLMVFLFLTYSRLPDVFASSLRLPLLFAVLSAFVTAATGGLRRALLTPVGLCLSAFSVWMILTIPTSAWPGGSAELIAFRWSKSFLTFVIVAGLLRTVGDCRRAAHYMAAASAVAVLLCLIFGNTEVYGRLTIDQGVLSNPNEVAQLLLIGLPFLLFVATNKSQSVGLRSAAAVFALGALVVVGRTGSRGGILAAACLALVGLLTLSWRSRIALVVASAVVLAVAIPLISPQQRARYLTTVQTGSEDSLGADERSAIESREQRLALLQASIDITLRHPLLGVGVGQFEVVEAGEAEARGERGMWRVTHNTYTQVSSETGLPGLFFFLCALAGCFRLTRSVQWAHRIDEDADLANIAYCVWLALIGFAVTAFFSSSAYLPYLPTLAGFSVGVGHAANGLSRSTTASPAHTGLPVQAR